MPLIFYQRSITNVLYVKLFITEDTRPINEKQVPKIPQVEDPERSSTWGIFYICFLLKVKTSKNQNARQ